MQQPKKYNQQILKNPSKKEKKEIRNQLSDWNNIEDAIEKIGKIENDFGVVINSSPSFKMVRECRCALNILAKLASEEVDVRCIKMNGTNRDWPDFWIDVNGMVIPCELVGVYDPEPKLVGIPLDMRDGEFVLDANKDYSSWPEDKFLITENHRGHWYNATNRALREGDEMPLGMFAATIEELHEWTAEAIISKNETAEKGNYVEGTILIVSTEFPMMKKIPSDFLNTIHPVLSMASLFRSVILHIENWPLVMWDNPEFSPVRWRSNSLYS